MKKYKQDIKSDDNILKELLLKQRLHWFVSELKDKKLYTKKWEDACNLYLNTRLQDEAKDFQEEFSKFDFGAMLNDIVEFLIWQDENFADNDYERFLYFEEE